MSTSSGETRITNEQTGGEKGSKPAQLAWAPADALLELGNVYGYGAEKYTKYGECDCFAAVSPSRRKDSVLPVTPVSGSEQTETSEGHTSGNEVTTEANRMGSSQAKWSAFWPEDATSVVRSKTSESTTTTNRGAFGDASVIAATSDSVITRGGSQSTEPQHLPTCASRQVVNGGAHNFRLGYNVSLSLNALWRHVLAFQGGEDTDPESGRSHLAHAAWHCLNMIQTLKDHPEMDDRWGPAENA